MQEYKLQQKHLKQAISKIMTVRDDIEGHRTLTKEQKLELLDQVRIAVSSLSKYINEK